MSDQKRISPSGGNSASNSSPSGGNSASNTTESLEETLKWCVAQSTEAPKISAAPMIAGTWLFLIIISAAVIYLTSIKRRS